MEKQVSLKSLCAMWCIGLAAVALVLIASSQIKTDYADSHNWIVNHSKIPSENR